MAALFRDARLKVEWAKKHIRDIQCGITSLQDSCTATIQRHPETNVQELIHAIPKLDAHLLELSLIAGDAIHNLHCAVDFAWFALHESNGWPTSNRTKFPVRTCRQDFEAALHGIEIDTRAPQLFDILISGIQAYKGGKGDVICTLHDLDISDKHILLLELTPHAGIKGISLRDKDGKVWKGGGMPTQSAGPYVIPIDPDTHIENKGQLAFKVVIEKTGTLKNMPIVDLLLIFCEFVMYILQTLESFGTF